MGRSGDDPGLTRAERERLAALKATTSLADLVALVDAETEHAAYVAAKAEWSQLRAAELAATERVARRTADADGSQLPGTTVTVDGHDFVVHGITHADTDAERSRLRRFEATLDPDRTTVYCEQGIRPMYFADRPDVCEMDDYRWAMAACRELDVDSHLDDVPDPSFAGLSEEVGRIAGRFREAVFAAIDQYGRPVDSPVAATLGEVASAFFTSHEDLATGEDFEAFRKTREAATDPTRLRALQEYYRRTFLPQPLEREWLCRHDPELEIMTHARNERMAEYAVAHNDTSSTVHLLVGAAHQPGIAYYLRRIRDGTHSMADFEPMG